MSLKQFIIIFVLSASLIVPMFVSAQTVLDIQAQITALQAQIAGLQQRLIELQQGFHDGDRIQTSVLLNVRSLPSTGAAVITKIPARSNGNIRCDLSPHIPTGDANPPQTPCPTTADGYTWWYIQWDAGYTGWSAEGNSEATFLTKLGNLNICPPPQPTTSCDGTWQTTQMGIANNGNNCTIGWICIPSTKTSKGTIIWAATLNGAPWTGTIRINGTTPVDAPSNYPVPTGTYPNTPAGNYAYSYVSGGPAGATFQNITPSGSQTLNANRTITFTFNFTTTNTSPLSVSCSGSPSTINPGQTVRWTATATGGSGNYAYSWADTKNNTAGTGVNNYWDRIYGTGPDVVGASVIATSPGVAEKSASCGSITVNSSTISTKGTIIWEIRKDGVLQSGSVVVNGVTPVDSPSNLAVPAGTYQNAPAGVYAYSYISGGPAGAMFQNITPSGSQMLSANGTITFTFNFTTTTSGASPTITTTSLPDSTVGNLYSTPVSASGGTGSYTWSITSGALPPGLILSQGAICSGCQWPIYVAGTPTTPGTYSFTIQVTASGASATRAFTVTIAASVPATTWIGPGTYSDRVISNPDASLAPGGACIFTVQCGSSSTCESTPTPTLRYLQTCQQSINGGRTFTSGNFPRGAICTVQAQCASGLACVANPVVTSYSTCQP